MLVRMSYTDTLLNALLQFSHQIMFACICFLCTRIRAICVCVFTHVCMMQCLEVPEYISRCVQSGAGLWLLYPPPCNPSVGSSQMAICKTWPCVSPLPRLAALPCTTAPLPHPSSSSHHSFYFLLLLSLIFPMSPSSHFHTSCALCILSLPVYLPLLFCLFIPLICPS